MASLRQRKGSRFWYACITLPDGRQKQFSTGLHDRLEALAVATAAERAGRKHAETPHQLRRALDRLAEDFVPAADAAPGPWLQAWAASRAGEVKPKTLSTYRNTMDEVAGWLARAHIRSFGALTARQVTALRDYWATRNNPPTANSKLKHLRVALGDAVKARLLDHNPAAEVGTLKCQTTVRREFRPAELELLLPSLTGEWQAIVALGLYTGQRLGDLAVLRWRQVDLANGTITLTTAKTGRLVALPLVARACDALLALPAADAPDAYVFPGIAGQAASSRSNTFRGLLAEVGLAPGIGRSRKNQRVTRRTTLELSFHSLRHTATSLLKAAGVSDAIARAIIGHESAAVSRQYTHLDMATMRQALEKMPTL
jgi:integrase